MNYGIHSPYTGKITQVTYSLNRKKQVSRTLDSWEKLELAVESSEYKEANLVIKYIKENM
jgi:hypothetical protein